MLKRITCLITVLSAMMIAISALAVTVDVAETENNEVQISVLLEEDESLAAAIIEYSCYGLSDMEVAERADNVIAGLNESAEPSSIMLAAGSGGGAMMPIPASGNMLIRVTMSKIGESWGVTLGEIEKIDLIGGIFSVVSQPCNEPVVDSEAVKRELTVYPNPSRGETSLMLASGWSDVAELSIFDVRGRLVRKYERDLRHLDSGVALTWDSRDNKGLPVAAGTYFARVSFRDGKRVHKKMMLVR